MPPWAFDLFMSPVTWYWLTQVLHFRDGGRDVPGHIFVSEVFYCTIDLQLELPAP